MDAFARCSISTNWRPSSGTLSNALEPNVPWSVSIRQGTLWRSDLGDPWSQRNWERALWMGCRVWLLQSNVPGPGIYKSDPAGEYTKHNLRETVCSFCKSFLDCNFRSQRLIAKSSQVTAVWKRRRAGRGHRIFLVISWCTRLFLIVVRVGISDSHRRWWLRWCDRRGRAPLLF